MTGGPLGCGENTASIWDRCLTQKITDLDDVTCLEYARELDDLSEASVVVGRNGLCCETLDQVRSWRHQLVIHRSGDLVWTGPILRSTYNVDSTSFLAFDGMAWFDRRLTRADREVCGALVDIFRHLVDEGRVHPDGAPDETCMRFEFRGCTHSGCREYEACKATIAAEVRTLARGPLNFSVVGNLVVVWCGPAALGRTTMLQDTDFQGDLAVVEDGFAYASAVCVQGKGVIGYCGGTDPYYGLVELPIKDDTITTQEDADALACAEVAARAGGPPVVLSVPDGIRLDPRAPVDFAELVPGVIMPVWSQATCRSVNQDMVLTRVRVRQGCGGDDGDDEEVLITVAPAASIGQ